MHTFLAGYEEQKQDMKKEEKQERLAVITRIKDALKLLRQDFDMQTKQFEIGGGYRQVKTI